VESAVAQPQMSFDGVPLYPTIAEGAAALCLSLVMNHPFIDGNKRVGHASMETFLVLNGYELAGPQPVEEAMEHGQTSYGGQRQFARCSLSHPRDAHAVWLYTGTSCAGHFFGDC
jgi:prophage maintenance system killer protein